MRALVAGGAAGGLEVTSGVASGVEAERRGSSDPPQRAGFAERRTSRAAPRFTRCACDPPGPDRVWVGEVLRGLPARTRFVPSARSRTGGSALIKEVSRGGKRAHCGPRFRASPLPFPMGTPNPDGRNCAPRIPPTRARRGDCLTRPSAQRSGLTRPTHRIFASRAAGRWRDPCRCRTSSRRSAVR